METVKPILFALSSLSVKYHTACTAANKTKRGSVKLLNCEQWSTATKMLCEKEHLWKSYADHTRPKHANLRLTTQVRSAPQHHCTRAIQEPLMIRPITLWNCHKLMLQLQKYLCIPSNTTGHEGSEKAATKAGQLPSAKFCSKLWGISSFLPLLLLQLLKLSTQCLYNK